MNNNTNKGQKQVGTELSQAQAQFTRVVTEYEIDVVIWVQYLSGVGLGYPIKQQKSAKSTLTKVEV